MAKKLTADEFGRLLINVQETVDWVRSAEKNWDFLNPPPDLERAALDLHCLTEALTALQRKVLAQVANNVERARLEVQLRAELKGKA